jgi:L-ascorbate metabolism protein UlaG (beta-lactamase superfamily)
METDVISREKNVFSAGLIGGPTVVIDYGGLRLVTDPTFDPPGPEGAMTKLEGPALDPSDLGPADAILLSHDQHPDNLDRAGRKYAATAERILAGPETAARLGASATGLATWQATALPRPGGGTVQVRALPAVHGPLDGARDAFGNVNCEVTGFLLTGDGLPSVYVSGDNASIEPVAQIAARYPATDIAVLFTGAARVAKERGRPLTLTAQRAADAALLLGARRVLPAHCRGWSHYSEGPGDLRFAFDEAGISDRLQVPEPGTWALRDAAA